MGKSSRPGKRGPSSSSSSSSSSFFSNLSSVVMLLFVAFCLFGVYMLTSSSTTPDTTSQHHYQYKRTAVRPRAVLRDPLPAAHDDTQMDLPEDAIKGDAYAAAGAQDEAATTSTSGDQGSESWRNEKQQQDEEVETHRVIKDGLDEARQQTQIDDNQLQSQPQSEEDQPTQSSSEDEDQQQTQNEQQDQHNNDQEEEQQQGDTSGGNQQEETDNNNESQQTDETDIESHEQQQPIQQVTERSESQLDEEGGAISEARIEHDTDGTTEHHKSQEHEQESQEDQQQPLHQEDDQQQQQQDEEQAGQQQESSPSEYEAATGGGGGNDETNNNQSSGNTWTTQADHSSSEKERRKGEEEEEESSSSNTDDEGKGGENGSSEEGGDGGDKAGAEYDWKLCNVTAGADYIPCLDNEKAIKKLHSFRHFEHRERHCPEESPTCLVPLPKGYKQPIQWPHSRDKIWYNNVPRTKLAEVKGHQNWVKVTGEYLTFPGGGTQFIHGALHYIDFIQEAVPDIAWGKRTRVILDVGCGVASFGGFLFERDVLAMSFAPKDEHEAQVQFALERGIPAISAVMGSQRLPFPSRVFDIVHCARCRVPWHANGGTLLLELNRVLRPGGFFVWSATPVYQKLKEDVEIWQEMTALTKNMCWELVTIKKDKLNSIGAAIYRKPTSNDCYEKRAVAKPPMCQEDDDANAAWYVPLQSCMHRVPEDPSERGTQWPEEWPKRVQVPPYWLNDSQKGVYGNPAPDDFTKDYEHWKRVLNKSYLKEMGIDWSHVRNVMDMRAIYGGFAAALRDMKVWVMNLVNVDAPDTLPIIYERGLFGMYHDWCESFSTYPRTYDLLHSEQLKQRCNIVPVVAEVDRIVRPGGYVIVRDESGVVSEVEKVLKSLHWEIRVSFANNGEGILCAEKSFWRPEKMSTTSA